MAIVKDPGPDVTQVTVAVFHPTSGRLQSNEQVAHLLFTQIQTQLFSRALWAERFAGGGTGQHASGTSEEQLPGIWII